MRYPPVGEEGQQKLSQGRALICGCGALGSVLANTLARAGVGNLRLVDRDFLETNNLQRQVLYDEQDVAAGIPKAIAAQTRLQAINSQINIEAVVTDVDHTNIGDLLDQVDVILDGTDNFETRFLLNDAALQFDIPWIYGGCIGAEGQTMTIVPGETPCLHCLMQGGPPPPGTTPTCDSAGILGPIVNVIASYQAVEALKLLSGNQAAINRDLKDIVRLDPRVYLDESFNDSIQCAGAHPRFNSLTVDGIGLNDGFGLNSNGYPTQQMPFPFDAIQNISVELAPFDVEYGSFTACNINAVTKSGTNEFHGSAFYDYGDDSLVGDQSEGDEYNAPAFEEKRYGFTLGGPILKDRLFFFGAYEKFEGPGASIDRVPENSSRAGSVVDSPMAFRCAHMDCWPLGAAALVCHQTFGGPPN
jgi:molybdopterin/thiamine biosynthesis adenylyltransferase